MSNPGVSDKGGQYMRSATPAMFRHKSSAACRFCITVLAALPRKLSTVT
jgi:hypothetical protein